MTSWPRAQGPGPFGERHRSCALGGQEGTGLQQRSLEASRLVSAATGLAAPPDVHSATHRAPPSATRVVRLRSPPRRPRLDATFRRAPTRKGHAPAWCTANRGGMHRPRGRASPRPFPPAVRRAWQRPRRAPSARPLGLLATTQKAPAFVRWATRADHGFAPSRRPVVPRRGLVSGRRATPPSTGARPAAARTSRSIACSRPESSNVHAEASGSAGRKRSASSTPP